MTKYLMIGSAVALAIAAGIIFYLKSENDTLHKSLATEKANVARLEGKIQDLNGSIKLLEDQRVEDQAALNELTDDYDALHLEKEEADANLEKARSRLDDLAIKKPGLIGRLATRATGRLMHQFEQASGGGKPDRGD